jgi:hypothetical protein
VRLGAIDWAGSAWGGALSFAGSGVFNGSAHADTTDKPKIPAARPHWTNAFDNNMGNSGPGSGGRSATHPSKSAPQIFLIFNGQSIDP